MSRMDSGSNGRRLPPGGAILLLCLALAIGCADDTPSAPYDSSIAPPPPVVADTGPTPTGLLAVTFQPENEASHIYTVRPDGSGLTQLTPDDHQTAAPTWSPDGTRIAYQNTGEDEVEGIWIMRADGSGAARIAPRGASPFWLDDARIGYGCGAGICVVEADGSSAATLIAHQPPLDMTDHSFTLSPDGTRFAFVRRFPSIFNEVSRVYVMTRDGTSERALTPNAPFAEEMFPSWSGDGKRIAFYSSRYGIAVADADGRSVHGISHQFQIVPDIAGGAPAWSPDGTRIVFGADARRFYIANADGSGVIRRVTVNAPVHAYTGRIAQWSWTSR